MAALPLLLPAIMSREVIAPASGKARNRGGRDVSHWCCC
jgi:hypothetical protein